MQQLHILCLFIVWIKQIVWARHTIQIYFTELLQICCANMRADQKKERKKRSDDCEEWKNSIFRACHNIFFPFFVHSCHFHMHDSDVRDENMQFLFFCWILSVMSRLIWHNIEKATEPNAQKQRWRTSRRRKKNEEKLKSYDSHLMHFGFDCLLRYIYNAHNTHTHTPIHTEIGCSVWMSIGNMNELNGFFFVASHVQHHIWNWKWCCGSCKI